MRVACLVRPSREAGCQEAQVFPTIEGRLCLSGLHKQASCLPAPSSCSIAPGTQDTLGRGKGTGRVWAGWKLLLLGVVDALFRAYRILKGLWAHPLGQRHVIPRSAPARCHLFPIVAEHELVCVVTIAQKNHSANKCGNVRFQPLFRSLFNRLQTWTLKILNLSPMSSTNPKKIK